MSNSEYLVRNRVQAANQQDLVIQGGKCALCNVQGMQCVFYKSAMRIVQGVQYALYKLCSVYYTGTGFHKAI